MKLSRSWTFFIALQATGLIALLGSNLTGTSKATAFLWSLGFVALLPGDSYPASAVEHFLWQSSLSWAILPLELVAAVAANTLLWFILLYGVRSIRNRGVA
jgi:hypothetical protein